MFRSVSNHQVHTHANRTQHKKKNKLFDFLSPTVYLRLSSCFSVCFPFRQVFKIYFKDGSGGWFLPIVLVIVSVLTQVVSNTFDYWLSYWSDKFLEDGAVSARQSSSDNSDKNMN